ncbi:MAG: 1-acyl-sn-glycerol-3-phosphate acyltransferase [Muribaculaceae bacterium]|nr:1-acyl-sn-glycerol-3-phosphate acyltransferase [Muribaculaceae bacterium]
MIVIYRIYQFTIMWPLMLAVTFLTAMLTALGSMAFGGRWWGYYPPALWSRIMCILSFVKVEVRGREHISRGTSYVFVANHQGAYDIFSVYGYLGHNFKWMMKKSLENIPLVGWACKRAGQIFVDNSSPHAIHQTMVAAEKQLAGGMSLVVFPEGARSWDGRMRRFKRGAYTLAREFGLPVVPLTIDGAFHVMPRYARLPRYGKIILTIHEPIASTEPELIELSRQAIASSLPCDETL